MMLKFGQGINNKKLVKTEKLQQKKIYSLSLPAGYSCRFAKICRSCVVTTNDNCVKIKDGRYTKIRCYATQQELMYQNVRKQRHQNYKKLRQCKSAKQITTLFESSFPSDCGICRMHVSGDFFSQTYFNGFVSFVKNHKNVIFYGYTKAFPYIVNYINKQGKLPNNLRLVLSYGGTHDHLIWLLQNDIHYRYFSSVKIVNNVIEAHKLKLPVDYNDCHAIYSPEMGDFALLKHGTQPKK